MSRISQLEGEIRECQEKIRGLKEEQEKLEKGRRQNEEIANTIGQHVSNSRERADLFRQYNQKTTISKLLAEKLEENYSRTEETKLLGNYDEIDREIQRAIQKIEEEIEEQKCIVSQKQRSMKEIRCNVKKGGTMEWE